MDKFGQPMRRNVPRVKEKKPPLPEFFDEEQPPAALESPVLIAPGFPQGWYYSVACTFYDKKVRTDKYWQGPDLEIHGELREMGYRSFKQIEELNKGIELDRDVFLADCAKTVEKVVAVMEGTVPESAFTDRELFPGLPDREGGQKGAPLFINKKNTYSKATKKR